MKLHELEAVYGSTKNRKRVGRGQGSGTGKTSGKGEKGQNARSSTVNVEDLNRFEDDTVVTIELLKEVGLIKKELDGVKVLGNGELKKKLTVKANAFTRSAIEKINNNGGKTEVI